MKIPSILIIVLFSFVSSLSFAQVGNVFPSMSGETLDNKPVELPANASGKFTLIGVAYSQKAQKDLETWAKPVYYEFIDKSGLSAMVYDVNVYLVMMFTGANKAVYSTAGKKIRKETDPVFYPYTFLFKGNLSEYDKLLDLPDKDTPAFYVLDQNGKIIHITTGAYTSKKLEKIGSLVEN